MCVSTDQELKGLKELQDILASSDEEQESDSGVQRKKRGADAKRCGLLSVCGKRSWALTGLWVLCSGAKAAEKGKGKATLEGKRKQRESDAPVCVGFVSVGCLM
jgi:hypothetical protein